MAEVAIGLCPFCNGKSYAEPPSLGRSHWNVVCDDCGASGPHAHDDAMAIRRWNDRFPARQTTDREDGK